MSLSFCLPSYQPDAGDEDLEAHSASATGVFYALMDRESTWGLVYSSMQTWEAARKRYPDARSFTAATWKGITELWLADCEMYHPHAQNADETRIGPSDSISTAQRPASPTKARRAASPAVAFTTNVRRPASPVKPKSSRARSPTKSTEAPPRFPPSSPTKRVGADTFPAPLTTVEISAKFEALFTPRSPSPLLYAVSGVNRIFQDRGRALVALKAQPGADLVFAYDEDTLWAFVDAEAERMRKMDFAADTAVPMPREVTLSSHASPREETIADLAEQYDKSVDYIRKVLVNGTGYGGKRGVNLRNAISHDMALKAKEDGGEGGLFINELSGEDYQQLKATMSEDEKKRLLDQLAASRSLKKHGARATNKAVAMDTLQTSNQIGLMISDLSERTGVRAFAMFTRAHPYDPVVPCVVDSEGTRDFFQDVFKCSDLDAVRKLELWACTHDGADDNKLRTVQKKMNELITEGLCKVKNNKKLDMHWENLLYPESRSDDRMPAGRSETGYRKKVPDNNKMTGRPREDASTTKEVYRNYDLKIVDKLGVKLVGWPEDVPMRRPSKIPADDARKILEKLQTGAIHWVVLTKKQRAEEAAKIEELRSTGGVKQRKSRSDKGVPRGPRNGGKKKKGKKGKKTRDDDESSSSSDSEDADEGDGDEEPQQPPASRLGKDAADAPTAGSQARQARAPGGEPAAADTAISQVSGSVARSAITQSVPASVTHTANTAVSQLSAPPSAPSAPQSSVPTVPASVVHTATPQVSTPATSAPISTTHEHGQAPAFAHPSAVPLPFQFDYDFDFSGMDFDTSFLTHSVGDIGGALNSIGGAAHYNDSLGGIEGANGDGSGGAAYDNDGLGGVGALRLNTSNGNEWSDNSSGAFPSQSLGIDAFHSGAVLNGTPFPTSFVVPAGPSSAALSVLTNTGDASNKKRKRVDSEKGKRRKSGEKAGGGVGSDAPPKKRKKPAAQAAQAAAPAAA
ncbi:hypothetical protein B0H13DRAFT_2368471 [Mycena leptocephala]|nr:hypothetical protein B0H13DRAFT_2368471 [Mycena leptocephala]